MKEVGKRMRIGAEYVKEIKRLYRKGVSQQEISRRLGIGDNTVHRVLKREGII
jgi:DNA invertase Pin-like site-specific DNA recombinase